MKNDPLDVDVSLSVDLLPSGVKGTAKSRAVAAFDRLLGNVIDLANPPLERLTATARARTELNISLINSIEAGAKDIISKKLDVIEIIAAQEASKIFRHYENKAAVVREALSDLERQPPSDAENSEGPSFLDVSFLNRFERYSEDADTAELRERWGRVLSSELRRPGTFSVRVLRVVDEIDAHTARLFEDICKWRINNVVPSCLIGDLTIVDRHNIVSSDLVIDPGIVGLSRPMTKTFDGDREVWFASFDKFGIGFSSDVSLKGVPNALAPGEHPIIVNKDDPQIPIYILTDTGSSIASIIGKNEIFSIKTYAAMLAKSLDSDVHIYFNDDIEYNSILVIGPGGLN